VVDVDSSLASKAASIQSSVRGPVVDKSGSRHMQSWMGYAGQEFTLGLEAVTDTESLLIRYNMRGRQTDQFELTGVQTQMRGSYLN